MDIAATVDRIRALRFAPRQDRPRPWLLFDAASVGAMRGRVAADAVLRKRLESQRDEILKIPSNQADTLQTYVSAHHAATMANVALLLNDEPARRWTKEMITSVLRVEDWMAPVHKGSCRVYDHCMGNIVAALAVAHDSIADAYTPAQTLELADGLRRHALLPFLSGTGENPEWWFRASTESNWKVMTCGESGLGFLSFADLWPEAPEAIARAAQGVLQTLERVPPEGDWPEGIGYWYATLMMGLRFARGLRRVSGGAVNLFEHPALRVTGDYALQLTTPSDRVYNFNDNVPTLGDRSAEALAMLALEQRRGDWMRVARASPAPTALFLACDDPSIASAPNTRRQASFPRTGVAVMRSGQQPDATFVGLKAGPPAVGHSHLDANSFVIEARGQPLLIDHPYWPQAHFLGFFDARKYRWNFDGPGTPGHTTILVDGKGQTYADVYVAALGPTHDGGAWQRLVGDASRCYPGLIRRFVRSIVLLGRDLIVVRDVIECEGERHVEWLMHHAGEARDHGLVTLLEVPGLRASVTPFLPDRTNGWRVSDVVRTSHYVNSDTLQPETLRIRYRSFSPFRAAERFEFLTGFRIDGTGEPGEWAFDPGKDGNWTLRPGGPAGQGGAFVPEGDLLAWKA